MSWKYYFLKPDCIISTSEVAIEYCKFAKFDNYSNGKDKKPEGEKCSFLVIPALSMKSLHVLSYKATAKTFVLIGEFEI